MSNQRSLEPLRGKKMLVIIAMAFVLVGTFGFASAAEDLQIWRNTSTGANVTTVDNNGNWNILGNIDFFGIISGDGSGLTGILGSQIANDLNWINSTSLSEADPLWTSNQTLYPRTSELVGLLGNFSAWDKDYADLINTPTLLTDFTDDLGNRGYDSLSNFTDDLGDRGYTDLSNFTNSPGYLTEISGLENDPLWTSNQTLYPRISELVGFIGNFSAWDKDYSDLINTPILLSDFTDDILWTAGFNATGDARWSSSYNSTYDLWAYNQTIPAIAYADATFIRNDGDNATGEYNFDGGWQAGGASIIGGNLYAQALYAYDINSLSVSHLEVNGSLIPAQGFDNQFDIGNSTLRWRNAYFSGNVVANGTVYSNGVEVLTAISGLETDPHWTSNQSSYSRTSELVGLLGNFSAWDKDYADLINTPTSLSSFTDDLGDRGYTDLSNFTNSPGYLTSFSETDPLWSANFTLYNTTWSTDTDTTYSHLTNFTDDLGDRGYNSLSNFTDDILWTGSFNATGDSRWLTELTDTLQTVTDRGAVTTNRIDINHDGAYVDSALRLTRGIQAAGNDPAMPVTFGYPYLEIGAKEWFANSLYTIGFGWDDGNKQSIEIGMVTTDTSGNVAGDFVIATRTLAADSGLSEKFRLTAAGDLGIGTNSPSTKLDVNGTVTAIAFIGDGSGLSGLDVTDVWVNSSGDTMSGALDMGNNAITNINWATSDDGIGSGLDADLLDGQNGAYYLDDTDTQDLGTSGNTITLVDGGSITAPYATNAGSLAANGANCAAGSYPLGVNAAGAVEGCTVDDIGSDTWNANALNIAGYVAAPSGATINLVWKTDASGNPAWRADAVNDGVYDLATMQSAVTNDFHNLGGTDANTWNANTQAAAGYVAAGGLNYNLVWKTDGSGNPAWRADNSGSDTQDLGTSGNTITLVDGGSITAPYATNAGTLDGIDSLSFLRSDTADTASGLITFTAISAFNGGASGSTAPFTVDSTYKVSNLNADLLDGHDTSYFATAAEVGDYVLKAGDTMSGALNMGDNAITAVNGLTMTNDADITGADLIQGYNDLRFAGDASTVDLTISAAGLVTTTAGLTVGTDLIVNGGDLTINNNNGGINFNDVSKYWMKTSTNWGLYWDTTNNQIDFMGGGTERAYIDLDTGEMQSDDYLISNGVKANSAVNLIIDGTTGEGSVIVVIG